MVRCALCLCTDFHTHDVRNDPIVQSWHTGGAVQTQRMVMNDCNWEKFCKDCGWQEARDVEDSRLVVFHEDSDVHFYSWKEAAEYQMSVGRK